MKIPPLKPRVEELTTLDRIRIRGHQLLDWALMLTLFWTAAHILYFYVQTSIYGIPETTAVRYAAYIAIGCFFALFVHRKEIQDRFGSRQVEPVSCSPDSNQPEKNR